MGSLTDPSARKRTSLSSVPMRERTGMGMATILFTDLVGSTAIRTALGDDAADRVFQEHNRILDSIVVAHGGDVVQHTGDGILAVFDSASRAVDAAVEAQVEITKANTDEDAALHLRMGLSAGDISWEGGDCFGSPVVEAARIQAVAEGDQILCSQLVRLLAGSRTTHEFRAIGELELKGLDEPVPTLEVIWEGPADSGIALPAGLHSAGSSPLVGRGKELRAAGEAWQLANEGSLQALLISGEAGVGKTRLVSEFANRVHADGAVVLFGRCDESVDYPYQPFAEAVLTYVRSCPEDERLSGLGSMGSELVRLVPSLGELAALAQPVETRDRTDARYLLFEATAEWLKQVSAGAPSVFVMEDLQWAAKPTLDLVAHVAHSCARCPILLVVTYRASDHPNGEPLHAVLGELYRTQRVTAIELGGLERDDVARLVEAVSPDRPSDDFTDAILAETSGNPFFITELLKSIPDEDGMRWLESRESLPTSLREIVAHRLRMLSPETRAALETCAVLGLDFRFSTLRAVCDYDERDLLLMLDEAVSSQLLRTQSGPQLAFSFSHALVRRAIYDSLTAPKRLKIHDEVADALVELAAGEPVELADIAHHYLMVAATGRIEEAIHYTIEAGNDALTKVAYDDAVGWYRRAIELVDQLSVTSAENRSDVLKNLSNAQWRLGDPSWSRTAFDAARAALSVADATRATNSLLINKPVIQTSLSEASPERMSLLRETLDLMGDADAGQRALLLAELALESIAAGHEPTEAEALSSNAIEIARRVGEPITLAEVLLRRESALVHGFENLGERLRNTSELLDLVSVVGDESLKFAALIARALAAGEGADLAEFEQRVFEANEKAEAMRVPSLLYFAKLIESSRAALRGDFAAAESAADAAASYGHIAELGEADYVRILQLTNIRLQQGRANEIVDIARAFTETADLSVPGQPMLAIVQLRAGDRAGAADTFEALMTEFEVHYSSRWKSNYNGLGELCARLGDTTHAQVLYDSLLPYENQLHNLALFLPAHAMALGMLAGVMSQYERADNHFARASDLHRRMKADPLEAANQAEWARVLLSRQDGGEAARVTAEGHLREAELLAGRCGAQQVLADVEEIAATLR